MNTTDSSVSVPAPLLVPTSLLAGALMCAGNADVRYYLNGVQLQVRGRVATVVGTDGFTLFAGQFATAEGFDGLSVTIPRELLDLLAPMMAARGLPAIAFSITGNVISTEGLRVNCSAELISGKFPDWRATVPKQASGEGASFDPRFLMRLTRIAKRLGRQWPNLQHNGAAAAVCVLGNEAVVLIMPVRNDEAKVVPGWARAAEVPHA